MATLMKKCFDEATGAISYPRELGECIPEDIQRVAKKYYNVNNRVVLHYLPKPANP